MNKVWMITGAGRGLGRAFVQEAVNNGDNVIVGIRKLNEDDTLLKNENILPVIMDVTKIEEVENAVKQGYEKFKRIDFVVNNAGFGLSGAFEEISDSELRNVFDTDYFGAANVIRTVLPIMRKQKSGRILNISSQVGLVESPGESAYCSAKYALVGLSETLNAELEAFNIQVVAVCPGVFRTDFRDDSSMKYPKKQIVDYEGTISHEVVNFIKENNHKQNGDPKKAAEFLYKMANKKEVPKVLTIGKECSNIVKQSYENILKEITSYYEEASKTSYDFE